MNEAKPKRRWFRFSLRTMFVLVTIAGGLSVLGRLWWRSVEIHRLEIELQNARIKNHELHDSSEFYTGEILELHHRIRQLKR
jgi:hypothetical protein